MVKEETERQRDKIRLIPSENYVSAAVLEATGSVLTNKYSEGYAKKRYYEGQQIIDQIELLAIRRAKALFGAEAANVQPYSGSPANLAVYSRLLPARGPDHGPGPGPRRAPDPRLGREHHRRLLHAASDTACTRRPT